MSNVFEMNGTVVYQGRPGHKSKDGKNWCYSITFLVNTSSPVCDLSISTEDRGASLWPGGLSLDPDINPETPDDDSIDDGLRLRRGKISEGPNGTPPTQAPKGSFVPDAKQPHGRTDSKPDNRDWSSRDTRHGPWQPGGWRRVQVDGELPDPKSDADGLHIEFEPCLNPGDALELRLCFDEELDENDFITFTPSAKDGSAIGGGDTTPSNPLTGADIIKILGGLAGAGASKLIGKRMSNKKKREQIAAHIADDKKLLRAVFAAASSDSTELSVAQAVRQLGASAILNEIGIELAIETFGTRSIAKFLGDIDGSSEPRGTHDA